MIIISSYKTLAEGQNLQYNVKDTDGLIRLPGKRKDKEKDLDGIYLGEYWCLYYTDSTAGCWTALQNHT